MKFIWSQYMPNTLLFHWAVNESTWKLRQTPRKGFCKYILFLQKSEIPEIFTYPYFCHIIPQSHAHSSGQRTENPNREKQEDAAASESTHRARCSNWICVRAFVAVVGRVRLVASPGDEFARMYEDVGPDAALLLPFTNTHCLSPRF